MYSGTVLAETTKNHIIAGTEIRLARYTEKGKDYWKGIRIKRIANPDVFKDSVKGCGRKPSKRRHIK